MTTDPAGRSEWFTPIWVVPALLLAGVIAYALADGPAPEPAAHTLAPTVTP